MGEDIEKGEPKVSVVIPTRNRSVLLKRALLSLQEQTDPSWEALVIDDGSTDDTAQMVAGMAGADPRIRYFRLERDGGNWRPVSRARNIGIREAKGEYMMFLDDDDEFMPRRVELQTSAAAGAPVVVCDGYHIDMSTGRRRLVRVPRDRHFGRLFRTVAVDHHALMVRRDVFAEIGGYDEHLMRAEDWEMMLRIAERHPEFVVVGEPLYVFYDRHFGRHFPADEVAGREEADRQIIRKYWHVYGADRKLLGSRRQYEGTAFMFWGYPRKARRRFLSSLRNDPSNLKSYLCLACSLLPPPAFMKLARLRSDAARRK